MESQYKLIVFDLDGTIADTIPDIRNAVAYSASEYGDYKISDETMRAHITGGAKLLIGGIFDELGIKGYDLDKHVELFRERYVEYNTVDTVLYPNAEDVLITLHEMGCKVALCTMKSSCFTDNMLKALKIEHLFDAVLCDDMMEKPKPDAWSIDHFAEKFGISHDKILMIGDGMTDMGMAHNAGIDSVSVTFGYGDLAELQKYSKYTIDRLTEIIDIVKGNKMDQDKIILSGDIDLYNVNTLKDQLSACTAKDILIDATDLQYIDSTGLGVLVSSLKKVQENDGKIKIVGLKKHIYKIFALTSLDKIFDIEVAE